MRTTLLLKRKMLVCFDLTEFKFCSSTWVWASSGKWWRTGKPGMLQPTLSQGVRHDWVTEQQQQHIKSGRSFLFIDPISQQRSLFCLVRPACSISSHLITCSNSYRKPWLKLWPRGSSHLHFFFCGELYTQCPVVRARPGVPTLCCSL